MTEQIAEDSRLFEEAVLYCVHRVFHASRWTMYPVMREAGATSPEEWLILVFLWMREGRTASELCDLMLRDRSGMTRLPEEELLVTRRTLAKVVKNLEALSKEQ